MRWTSLCKQAGVDPDVAFDEFVRTERFKFNWLYQIGGVTIPMPVNVATLNPSTLEIDEIDDVNRAIEILRSC